MTEILLQRRFLGEDNDLGGSTGKHVCRKLFEIWIGLMVECRRLSEN